MQEKGWREHNRGDRDWQSQRVEEQGPFPAWWVFMILQLILLFKFPFHLLPSSWRQYTQQIQKRESQSPEIEIHDALFDIDVEVEGPNDKD